jgi:hypothetical protein
MRDGWGTEGMGHRHFTICQGVNGCLVGRLPTGNDRLFGESVVALTPASVRTAIAARITGL